jgi:hypothetical protein
LYSLPLMLLFCRDSSHRQADALGGSPLTTIKIGAAGAGGVGGVAGEIINF